jgi:hypothetical protein
MLPQARVIAPKEPMFQYSSPAASLRLGTSTVVRMHVASEAPKPNAWRARDVAVQIVQST